MILKVTSNIDGSMILFINNTSLLAVGEHNYLCILKLKQDIPTRTGAKNANDKDKKEGRRKDTFF